MAMREFEDQDGTRWTVWDTVPANTIGFTGDYRRGWLTFDNGTDRCRLAPIPLDWADLPPERLTLLLRVAHTASASDASVTRLENERRVTERREAERRQQERRLQDRRRNPVTQKPA
jgi:hypothetical protein